MMIMMGGDDKMVHEDRKFMLYTWEASTNKGS